MASVFKPLARHADPSLNRDLRQGQPARHPRGRGEASGPDGQARRTGGIARDRDG